MERRLPLHTPGKKTAKTGGTFHRLEIGVCLFLVIATSLAYWQLPDHDFIGFDDDSYIAQNPYVRGGFSGENVIWAFTEFHAGNWHPLTWLSHMLDCELFGLKAGMHHLTNLLFHIANSILLFFVFRRMTGAIWQSAFVAALFALHPLHVESVAWVAERKDVLSTFFWMLTLWAYVRYTERPGVNRYIWVVILFALGLMAKPMVVTLPFVLLLMDFWPLGRMKLFSPVKGDGDSSRKWLDLHLIWEKVPLFILVLFSCVMTGLSEDGGGNLVSLGQFPLSVRLPNTLVSYASYIGKMIWPNNLAVFYPYPEAMSMWKTLGAGLLFIFISITVICYSRTRPYLAMGWLWYIGTLVPVIGLVQVGSQSMADRYTYIPLIGLFIMIGWGIPDLLGKWRYRQIVLAIMAGMLISVLLVVTRIQAAYWKNGDTLFRHTLNVTENNFVAHNGLGVALVKSGRFPEAIHHYSEAVKIRRDFADAYNNLGTALGRLGKFDKAVECFSMALQAKPNSPKDAVHVNMGIALGNSGDLDGAITHFKEALRSNPGLVIAQQNLARALDLKDKLRKTGE